MDSNQTAPKGAREQSDLSSLCSLYRLHQISMQTTIVNVG